MQIPGGARGGGWLWMKLISALVLILLVRLLVSLNAQLVLLFCNAYVLILRRPLPPRDKRFIAIRLLEVKSKVS